MPVVTAGTNSISVKVPLKGDDLPWGISKLTVSATDVYERTSAKTYLLNILDLTKTTADFAGVRYCGRCIRRADRERRRPKQQFHMGQFGDRKTG